MGRYTGGGIRFFFAARAGGGAGCFGAIRDSLLGRVAFE
jgi:hypothetical protein